MAVRRVRGELEDNDVALERVVSRGARVLVALALLGARIVLGRRFSGLTALRRHGRERVTRGRSVWSPKAGAAERIVATLERLVPGFVKLGQLASSLPQVGASPIGTALLALTERVAPAAWGQVERLLASELGERLGELAWISPVPLASGSIAQVHRARLTDGRSVVFKVQRPGIAELLAVDLALVKALARGCHRLVPRSRCLNLPALAQACAAGLVQQLDFEREAANMDELREVLATIRGSVHVPAVVGELTSRRVICMEYVCGTTLASLRTRRTTGLRASLGDDLVAAVVAPALRRGVFHGDVHAGNFLVMADGRLAVLDLGSLGRLSPEERHQTASLVTAVVACRWDEAMRSFARLVGGTTAPSTAAEPTSMAAIADLAMQHLSERPDRCSLSTLARGVLRALASDGCTLPPNVAALLEQLARLEGLLAAVAPDSPLLRLGARAVGAAEAA